MTRFFSKIDEIGPRLAGERYIVDPELSTALFLADHLEKPLLIEGPAGVGKTELAKAVAAAAGTELVRLQCYEGLDEAKALYEWEYGKQLLYTQILRDKIGDLTQGTASLDDAIDRLSGRDRGGAFFSEHFLLERPLLRAIRAPKRVVLLIDEVDRAEQEFEAFLLEVLSDFQVTVPELGTLRARFTPLVFLTSNRVREISDALRRRCLHLLIDYPSAEREAAIVRARLPNIEQTLLEQVVAVVQALRKLELRKRPSIAETIDWARGLLALHATALSADLIRTTLGLLVKLEEDHDLASRHVPDLGV